MKKKAIAELEALPWLRKKIREKNQNAEIEKSGSDKHVWFLRKGGITREPDFVVKTNDLKKEFIELQYSEEERKAYDFKISKITPFDRYTKEKTPKKDTKILYIIMPANKFSLVQPEWIRDNSEQTYASAWGNAPVYRVKADIFEKILEEDNELKEVWKNINKKIFILDFQHKTIDIEKDKMSYLFQQVIDENKMIKIIPKTLDSFFKACFILNNLEKTPENSNLWLVYMLSFTEQKLNSYELFQLAYCLDFLYPLKELEKNELDLLVKKIKEILKMTNDFSTEEGSYISDKRIPPLEETRYCLFVVNVLEDLIQDIIHYSDDETNLKPVTSIYQNIPDIEKTHDYISKP